MADKHKHVDEVSGVETTGHEWDGIRELNNPLPRWWVYSFYATIIWAIGYAVAYPSWPMLTEATKGVLGYSSRAEVGVELAAAKAAQAGNLEQIALNSVEEIIANPQLQQFAVSAGASVFKVNCAQCHGSGGCGRAGLPESQRRRLALGRQAARDLPNHSSWGSPRHRRGNSGFRDAAVRRHADTRADAADGRLRDEPHPGTVATAPRRAG